MLTTFLEHTKTVSKGIYKFLRLIVRQLRSFRFNRNFLVFLVFLLISTFLWFMQTAMETLTAKQEYPLKVVGVPKDVIYTTKLPEKVEVSVAAQGSTYFFYLIPYLFGENHYDLVVDYDDIDFTSSKMTISNSILKRNASKLLGSEFQVLTVNPTQVVAYYTSGRPKRLPIEFGGNISAGSQRVISKISISPDSADVYLPLSIYDSVKVVKTEGKTMKNVIDPVSFRIALKQIDKTKISPDSVDVKVSVDLQTETTLTVPIYSLNCPRNKIIRTFPGKAVVTFRTIASALNKTKADDFLLAVDYNKIKSTEKYCKVKLIAKPNYASNVRFTPQKVQFVMEQEFE